MIQSVSSSSSLVSLSRPQLPLEEKPEVASSAGLRKVSDSAEFSSAALRKLSGEAEAG